MADQAYFTVPKLLVKHPAFKTLSVEAKFLYAYFRDTHKLSVLNEWKDEAGTYIKLARQSIATLVGKSLPTVRRIIAELILAGLIRERRMGLTQCNRIYVQPLPGETLDDLAPKRKKPAQPLVDEPQPQKDPQDGRLWEFTDGDIYPYYTRSDLKRLVDEALLETAV